MLARVISYTPDGEKLVAEALKGSSVDENEVEELILESMRSGAWSAWERSRYVIEIRCSSYAMRYFGTNIISVEPIWYDALKALISRYVRCLDNDSVCHAVGIDMLLKSIEREQNRVKLDTLYAELENVFVVPYSVKMNRELLREYVTTSLRLVRAYLMMLDSTRREDAARFLPQSTIHRVVINVTARDLATRVLPKTMCSRADPEVRRVAWRLYVELRKVHPRLFKYVGPPCVVLANVRGERVAADEVIHGSRSVALSCPMDEKRSVDQCVRYAFESLAL